MTILDSYAVLALLKDEPAAGKVRALVDAGACRLTPLGGAEVADHLVRLLGVAEKRAALDVAQLGLPVSEPLSAGRALRAGLLRARHYHRRDRAVSLADCVAAEAARSGGEALATADPHLLALCRDEHIATIPLPDSRGITWSS